MSQVVTGKRHPNGCICGCQFVEGLSGRVVESRPDLDLVVAEFTVPSHVGVEARCHRVAYSVAEAAA